MLPCKFYKEIQKIQNEIGGNGLPSFSYQQPTCVLRNTVASNEWENCKATPPEGPCWDTEDQVKNNEELES